MAALLIDLAWKSALIAVLALLASHALRNRAAAERVLLLRIALAALLLLPVLAVLMPALELAVLPPEGALPAGAAVDSGDAPVAASPSPEWLDPAAVGWIAGSALILLHLAAGLLLLRRWTRAGRPVTDPRWTQAVARASEGLRRPVRLRVSRHVDAAVSWGVTPAWVLIDPALERRADQADAVIAHEIAHVRRLDWPVLIASRFATALFWFNPLVWLVERELVRQSELAADDDAVTCIARTDYAQTLLSVAGGSAPHPVCGMAGSTLARRIRRVLEGAAPRRASRLVCMALLIGGPALAIPLAAAKIVPAEAIVAQAQDVPPPVPAAPPMVQPAPVAQPTPVAAPRARAPRPPRVATRAPRVPHAPAVAPEVEPVPMPTPPAAPAPARMVHAPQAPLPTPASKPRQPAPVRKPGPAPVAPSIKKAPPVPTAWRIRATTPPRALPAPRISVPRAPRIATPPPPAPQAIGPEAQRERREQVRDGVEAQRDARKRRRDKARSMINAARGMRNGALRMEHDAEGLEGSDRTMLLAQARSLHGQAERLEKQGRQLLEP